GGDAHGARPDRQVSAGRPRGGAHLSRRDRLLDRPAARVAREEPVTAVRVGVDLIEIARIRRALERHGDGFRERCFTAAERAYCDSKPNPAQHYAGRFAAQEAVGEGAGPRVHLSLRGGRKPGVHLSGRRAAFADRVKAGGIELSMTHSRELAAAVAVVMPTSVGSTELAREQGSVNRKVLR